MKAFDMKGLVLRALFSRWPRPRPLEDGYSILLPSPMDMPFLLRYALEGLAEVDTSHCRQILVVPDGWGDDRGAALRRVIGEFDDPRIELVELRAFDYLIVRLMGKTGSAPHWLAIVNGTARARCEYIFLHDSDAFLVEPDALERQYRECRDRGLYTLGVTPRWDRFFEEMGYTIPGTWEMMYSTRWARGRNTAHPQGSELAHATRGVRLRHPALPPVPGLSLGQGRHHDATASAGPLQRDDRHLSPLHGPLREAGRG